MRRLNQGLKLPPFQRSGHDFAMTKPQFGHDITNKELAATQQEQVAKRIQSKLRVRKVGSQKRFSKEMGENSGSFERVSFELSEGAFEEKLQELWENSAQINAILSEHVSVLSAKVKERVMKEAIMLRCQSRGGDLEELLVGRVRRLCQLMVSEQRYCQRQGLLSRLLEDHMRKLVAQRAR